MSKAKTYAKPPIFSQREAEKRLRQDLASVEIALHEAEARARAVRDTRDSLLNDLAIMTGGKRSRA